ncbi:MAG: hypothetical protein ACNI25_06770 [Halarcobacter sp.]
MILIGDKLVPFEDICFIESIENISSSKANSTLIFNYNQSLLKYCFENSLEFAVVVNSIKEAIYVNSLNGKYIISEKNLAKHIQKVADNYMFDSKNLTIIEHSDEIEQVSKDEIDGVIYTNLLKK